jgi:hypothetical protein
MSTQTKIIETYLETDFPHSYHAVAFGVADIVSAAFKQNKTRSNPNPEEAGIGAGIDSVGRLRDLRAAYELDPTLIEVLTEPLYERVLNFQPDTSSVEDRMLTALVIRNTPLIEIMHSELNTDKAQGKAFVERLTTELCPLVAAAWADVVPDRADPSNFLSLRTRYPDALELFRELATCRKSGATAGTLKLSNRPATPFNIQLGDAYNPASGRFKADGADPRVHHDELVRIGWLTENQSSPYVVTDWTRIGRSCEKLLAIVEGLLTRGITIMTINAHVERNQVYLQHPPIPIPDTLEERNRVLAVTPWFRDGVSPHDIGTRALDEFCGLQQTTRMGDGATRNQLCVCGSGRKRKRCCVVVTGISPTLV